MTRTATSHKIESPAPIHCLRRSPVAFTRTVSPRSRAQRLISAEQFASRLQSGCAGWPSRAVTCDAVQTHDGVSREVCCFPQGFDVFEKGLKPGAVGLPSSTVVALASVAPALLILGVVLRIVTWIAMRPIFRRGGGFSPDTLVLAGISEGGYGTQRGSRGRRRAVL